MLQYKLGISTQLGWLWADIFIVVATDDQSTYPGEQEQLSRHPMMINSTRSNIISDHNICTNYFKLVRSLDAANSPSSWSNVRPTACPQVVAWMVVWPYRLCTGSWLDRRPGYPLLSVIIAMAFVHGLWWCWLWEENDISSASERERKSAAVTNCTPSTPIDWVIRYKNTTIGDISVHQRWQGIRMIFISWQITRNSSWTNLS